MRIRNKLSLLCVMVLLVSLFGANGVFADEILSSMTVSPPTQRMILAPGESYSGALRVSNSNDNNNNLKYSVSIGSFRETKGENSKDDYGTVDHITVSNYNEIMKWITLGKTEGEVKPNETDVVTYTINVPKNAPAGGQYATIIIRDETGSGNDNGGNIAIQNVIQFASIIYAEVAGETVEKGEVIENNVPTFLFGGPLVTSSIVKNEGNVHTDAKYTLQVWPLFSDKEIYSNAEDPKTSLILPESERYNTQTWDETPAIGIFRVKQVVEMYGSVSTVENIVILCPLWLLLVIIMVVIGVVMWLISKNRNRTKR